MKWILFIFLAITSLPSFASAAFPTQSVNFALASSEYALIIDATQTGLDFAGAMTIEGWFKFDTIPGTDGAMSLAGKWLDAGGQDSYLLQLIDQSGVQKIRFLNSNDGSSVGLATVNTSLVAGTWYHIAAIYTTDPLLEVVIDGTSVGTSAGSLKTSIFNGSGSFQVSGDNGATYFNGNVSMLRAWNTNRTAAEINTNKCNVLGSTTNLSGEWTFDGVYTDNSGNSNTLTAFNTPTFESDVTAACGTAVVFQLWKLFQW